MLLHAKRSYPYVAEAYTAVGHDVRPQVDATPNLGDTTATRGRLERRSLVSTDHFPRISAARMLWNSAKRSASAASCSAARI